LQEHSLIHIPPTVAALKLESARIGFTMACEEQTGCLLRTLAASKPAGTFLEIGTGTGISAAWILDGMDPASHLTSIDISPDYQHIAKQVLGHDRRITFLQIDGAEYIRSLAPESLDLIFPDFWPGKFTDRDRAIAALRPSGFYIIDDLLPQPNWPNDHQPRVDRLLADLREETRLQLLPLRWSSGILVGVKRHAIE
jgi:predicted O-methyltransferase YrrM